MRSARIWGGAGETFDYNCGLDTNATTISFAAVLNRDHLAGGTTYVWIGNVSGHPDDGGPTGHLPDGNGYSYICSDTANGLYKSVNGSDTLLIPGIDCAFGSTNTLRADRNGFYGWTLYKIELGGTSTVLGYYNEAQDLNHNTNFACGQYLVNVSSSTKVDDFNFVLGETNYNPFVFSLTKPILGTYTNSLIDINFTLQDVNELDTPKAKLYYSMAPGTYQTLLYSDNNLKDGVGVTCDNYDFSNPRNCGYVWDATAVSDANYFIDANIITFSEDFNALGTSGEFMKEAVAPTSFAFINEFDDYEKVNVLVSCSDNNSGCKYLYYRLDGGAWTQGSTFPLDINYSLGGSHAFDWYATDYAGNIEDTNSISFYIVGDLIAPWLYFDVNIVQKGFVSDFNIGLTLQCFDNKLDDLNFVITKTTSNGTTTLLNVLDANAAIKTIYNSLDLGVNYFTGKCIDSNGNYAEKDSNNIYALAFRLINEENGNAITDLNVIDVAQMQAFTYDGNNVYDYNIYAPVTKYFIDFDSVLRFDFTYNDVSETKLSREIDFGLLPDTNIGVCVAPFQSFYEQLLISSTEKDVVIFNDFAKCYNLASSTKFAYENALMVRAFTINKPYYLYTWIDGVKTLLTVLDGSKASVVNLDVLEFNKETYALDIATDTIVFKCVENIDTGICDQNTISIYYKALRGDNASVNLKIYKANTLLWEYTESDEPNEFNINWFYGAQDVNGDDVLKLVIVKTSEGGTVVSSNYWFNLRGQSFSGVMDASLAIIFSFLLLFVGLTMVAYRYAFGWFGIILCVIAIGVLNFAPGFWYVQFIEAVVVIIMAFIGAIFTRETRRSVN